MTILQLAGPAVLLLVGTMVTIAGWRVRNMIPPHWKRCTGTWTNYNYRHSPDTYTYTVGKDQYSGTSHIRFEFRKSLGGTFEVAYDPKNPAESHPARVSRNGSTLIGVGVLTLVASLAFGVWALAS
ncbi:hypothetical protein ICL81_10920 [Leucobacter sp. cx-328]|uniref:DUF3592 domain-containing protein n=1 Tax=unclassified Leucobacter TaxID=2621730 RepID=UPI00165EADFB|nr:MULTISPECIES: DUF3592 domain-containing protein [unclassified Leucobacter]MBC9945011.1 hypothetical protein [Leucobacter sp. cx-328]